MLKIGYYICLLLLTLGQYSIIYRSGEIKIYLFDISVFAYSIYGFLYFLSVKKSFRLESRFFPFLLFLLIALLSLTLSLFRYSFDSIDTALFYLLRLTFYILAGIVLQNMVRLKMINTEEILYSIIYSGVLLGISGLVQLVLIPDFSLLDKSLGWDPHKNRLAGTFFDPNFTGIYLVLCLILLFKKYYLDKNFSTKDYIYFLFLLVCTFLTFSRSAWGALSIVVFVYGLYKSKTLLGISLIVLFSTYFAVPRVQTRINGITDPSDSARLRIESWSNAWRIAEDNLLTGVGFNNYREAQKRYGTLELDNIYSHSGSGSDSSLLMVLATTGIFGLAVYLYSLVSPVLSQGNLRIMYISLVLCILVNSLFINSLFYPQVMFLIFSIYSFSHT